MPPEPHNRTESLLGWYRLSARSLPWRERDEPWVILVSEIMLQQTQVARVEPVFVRFLSRFPTPEDLAWAEPAEVVSAWEDLGYLRRAFNLAESARRISADGWPRSVDELRRLPGVGPYTAAAVACFAFGVPVPAIDINLRRVLSRWIGRPLAGAELHDVASDLLDRGRPAEWNQAVMDLGATLCRARNPACGACPVEAWCTDPTIVVASAGQSRFEGSLRQARASVLKAVAHHRSLAVDRIVAETGLDPERVHRAVDVLCSEGVLSRSGDIVRI